MPTRAFWKLIRTICVWSTKKNQGEFAENGRETTSALFGATEPMPAFLLTLQLLLGLSWLKMGAESACWKTSQAVIPARGQRETCRKSFLAVWVTYQTQPAKTPSHSQRKPRDLLLTREFFLVFSGKQGGGNSLWITAERGKKTPTPQDFLLKKL